MSTKLVSSEETKFGELIITMQRETEKKKYVLSYGYADNLYETLIGFYCDNHNWSQDKLDQYLDNEDNYYKELEAYIGMFVDHFDDKDNWEMLPAEEMQA